MKRLAFLCFMLVLYTSMLQAQPSSRDFCTNVTYMVDNFISVDKIKGDLIESKETFFGKKDIYAAKVELKGFKGTWLNDPIMGMSCEYESLKTFTAEEKDKMIALLKKQLGGCLGSDYSLTEVTGISFMSTKTGDDYYNFPEVSLSWSPTTVDPNQFNVYISFLEPLI